METRDPPSLFNRLVTPPLTLMLGMLSILWFAYSLTSLFQNLTQPIITFDKGTYYMLGVGFALLSLGAGIAIEFWGGRPLTERQSKAVTKMAISSLALIYLAPHGIHWVTDNYLKRQGYSVCREASHQWLFVRSIVYIKAPLQCQSDLRQS